jgi:mannose-6-phosphate isomerase-like protein (cupin superfamily)
MTIQIGSRALVKERTMPLGEDIRRVVTTVDADGKAVVLFDGDNPHKIVRPGRTVTSRLVWVTDETPADMSGTQDRAAVAVGIAPPAGGSIFRIIDIPPTPPEVDKLDPDYLHRQIGEHAPARGLPPRHPLMHRTRTIDYAIVMAGEIDMLLDDTEIHLKAGDVLIQQGTNHAWVNRGSEPCRIAFVLIDAREP